MARFFIVVPTFNSAEFLGACLAGLFEMQPGPFELHVRVQDGGSADGTRDVAESWAKRIAAGAVPNADRRRLSFVSAKDRGLYDAVATAFDAVAGDADEILTWIGSDDLLVPGALASVANVFERFPHIRWLTGQPQVMDRDGAFYGGWRVAYARRDLRRGLHDGRALQFVQQEGTFWRRSLYREAGGLRRDLRLAGDFDLWRRFARTDELLNCPFPLGIWRYRAGQASGDLSRYYGEVDRVLAEDGGGPRFPVEDVRRDLQEARYRTVLLQRNFGEDYAVREEGLSFQPCEGFGPMLRAQPEHDLHASYVEFVAPVALLRIPLLEVGVPYRVALRIRNWRHPLRVTVRIGATVIQEVAMRSHADPQVVQFRFVPEIKHPFVSVQTHPQRRRRRAWRAFVDRVRGRRIDRAIAGSLLLEDVVFQRDPPPTAAVEERQPLAG